MQLFQLPVFISQKLDEPPHLFSQSAVVGDEGKGRQKHLVINGQEMLEDILEFGIAQSQRALLQEQEEKPPQQELKRVSEQTSSSG